MLIGEKYFISIDSRILVGPLRPPSWEMVKSSYECYFCLYIAGTDC
jgi:hypothetical protein